VSAKPVLPKNFNLRSALTVGTLLSVPLLGANPVGVLYEPISESQVLCGVEDSADHID